MPAKAEMKMGFFLVIGAMAALVLLTIVARMLGASVPSG